MSGRPTTMDNSSDFYMPRCWIAGSARFTSVAASRAPASFDGLQRAAAGIDRDAAINPPHLIVNDDQALAGTRFLTWMPRSTAASTTAKISSRLRWPVASTMPGAAQQYVLLVAAPA